MRKKDEEKMSPMMQEISFWVMFAQTEGRARSNNRAGIVWKWPILSGFTSWKYIFLSTHTHRRWFLLGWCLSLPLERRSLRYLLQLLSAPLSLKFKHLSILMVYDIFDLTSRAFVHLFCVCASPRVLTPLESAGSHFIRRSAEMWYILARDVLH